MSQTARLGPTARPPSIHLGDIRITILDGGWLKLDGGAMFGIIPKPVWSKKVEADESNRIALATTCLLVETAGRRVLIESGVGDRSKYDEKERGFFDLSGHWLVSSLEAAGADPASIDFLILTHLHFDHAGGGTTSDGKGGFHPTFPRARYVVQRGEWQDAVEAHAVMSGTYRPENLAPLENAGVLALVDGDAEILPGVSVALLPGHTRHQQSVILRSGGQEAVLPADLMPTSAHVGLRWNMAYDLLPFENMVNKQRLLELAVRRESLLILGQDPHRAAWRAESDGLGGFKLLPWPD